MFRPAWPIAMRCTLRGGRGAAARTIAGLGSLGFAFGTLMSASCASDRATSPPSPGPVSPPGGIPSADDGCEETVQMCRAAEVVDCHALLAATTARTVRLRIQTDWLSSESDLVCERQVRLLWLRGRPSAAEPLTCEGTSCVATLCGDLDPSYRSRVDEILLFPVCARD